MAQKKKLGNIQYMIDGERARVKHIDECKKKVGMQLETQIKLIEQRAHAKKQKAQDEKKAVDDAAAFADALAADEAALLLQRVSAVDRNSTNAPPPAPVEYVVVTPEEGSEGSDGGVDVDVEDDE
ncbi:UNVERIFIED_CONTAM: hypothetical protein HDU68_007419 [Siphonaria sp. JEL0065]|nr:hypothetical protein HDU68_007419 [Siphonaria sp. JEL0065]